MVNMIIMAKDGKPLTKQVLKKSAIPFFVFGEKCKCHSKVLLMHSKYNNVCDLKNK